MYVQNLAQKKKKKGRKALSNEIKDHTYLTNANTGNSTLGSEWSTSSDAIPALQMYKRIAGKLIINVYTNKCLIKKKKGRMSLSNETKAIA